MVELEWISVKEAAALYGMNAEYFRRTYCDKGGIVDRLQGLRQRTGPRGRRRIMVLKVVILRLIADEAGRVG